MRHLIKYTQADPHHSRNVQLEKTVQEMFGHLPDLPTETFVHVDPDMDNKVIAALVFSNQLSLPYEACLEFVKRAKHEDKLRIVKDTLEHMKGYQRPPREFEMASVDVSAVISASCYAQLKRHRMLTIVRQPYNPKFGVTIPRTVEEVGLEGEYRALGEESSSRFEELQSEGNSDAPYVLTNGHQGGVLVKMNARELYHFSRLRQDTHAQWQIRELADKVVEKVKEKAPLTTLLIGGKDKFDEVRREVYS